MALAEGAARRILAGQPDPKALELASDASASASAAAQSSGLLALAISRRAARASAIWDAVETRRAVGQFAQQVRMFSIASPVSGFRLGFRAASVALPDAALLGGVFACAFARGFQLLFQFLPALAESSPLPPRSRRSISADVRGKLIGCLGFSILPIQDRLRERRLVRLVVTPAGDSHTCR